MPAKRHPWNSGTRLNPEEGWATGTGHVVIDSPPCATPPTTPPTLSTKIYPFAYTGRVGQPTPPFYVVMTNPSPATKAGKCGVALLTALAADTTFKGTYCTNCKKLPKANKLVKLSGGGTLAFDFSLTPRSRIRDTDVDLLIACSQGSPALKVIGHNTLRFRTLDVTEVGPQIMVEPPTTGIPPFQSPWVITQGAGHTGNYVVKAINLGNTGTVSIFADPNPPGVTGTSITNLGQTQVCRAFSMDSTTCTKDSGQGGDFSSSFRWNFTTGTAIYVLMTVTTNGTGIIPQSDSTRMYLHFRDDLGDVNATERGEVSVPIYTQ